MTSQNSNPSPEAPDVRRIVQGHPTYGEPDANKGGQNGAPKPDGRSADQSGGPGGGGDASEPRRGAD